MISLALNTWFNPYFIVCKGALGEGFGGLKPSVLEAKAMLFMGNIAR